MLRTGNAVVVLLTAAVLSGSLLLATTEESKKPEGYRIYEMRTYFANPGRIDALHARFSNHTNHLFVKHGMTLIGYWTLQDDRDTLVYILAYPSLEARKKSWEGFLGDPGWKKAFADSTDDGRLVQKVESKFLVPTEYSPLR